MKSLATLPWNASQTHSREVVFAVSEGKGGTENISYVAFIEKVWKFVRWPLNSRYADSVMQARVPNCVNIERHFYM